jgi:cell wall-associated NlpC family hydrolase
VLTVYEDTTQTLDNIPAINAETQWFAELKPAQRQGGKVRPCPHCLRRRHRLAAIALGTAGLLAMSVLGYAVHARLGWLSFSQPAAAAAIELPASHPVHAPIPPVVPQSAEFPRLHPRVVMPTTTPPTHQSVMTPRAVIAVTHRPSPPPTTPPPTPAPTTPAPTPTPTHSSFTPSPTPTPTHTHTSPPPSGSLGARLLAVAEGEQGVPYVFGGATPGGFDCSGLIFWAAGQLGITIPRDTFGMLAGSVHLEMVFVPAPGDLEFFGPGHVELFVRQGVSFGAQQTGTLVGFHNYGGFYVPTEYFRLV